MISTVLQIQDCIIQRKRFDFVIKLFFLSRVHEKNITSVGFQSDGVWLYTGGEDCMAKVLHSLNVLLRI